MAAFSRNADLLGCGQACNMTKKRFVFERHLAVMACINAIDGRI
jgi:hypothetical protein